MKPSAVENIRSEFWLDLVVRLYMFNVQIDQTRSGLTSKLHENVSPILYRTTFAWKKKKRFTLNVEMLRIINTIVTSKRTKSERQKKWTETYNPFCCHFKHVTVKIPGQRARRFPA